MTVSALFFERSNRKWCRGVVVQHVDSQGRGCEFDASMRHIANAIGEEDNGKPPHKIHFPRKNSGPCLWFLLRSKWNLRGSFSFHH